MSVAEKFSQDGGLAVLYGNLAEDGCIVKTAGVDESILKFSGPAKVFECQDTAVKGILGGAVKAGTQLDIGGAEVGFCCNNCKGKVEKASGDEQVTMVFGNVEKGFAPAAK